MLFEIEKKSVYHKYLSGGFSLIELMVSLTIFSILMVVSVGTLLTLIDVNAKAQALSSATTNLSFALDSITREIRTGHYYSCQTASLDQDNDPLPTSYESSLSQDCNGENTTPDNGNEIVFIRDRDGFKIGYRLYGDRIQQKIADPGGVTSQWENITSDDIEIEKFEIIVRNSTVYGTTGAGPGAQDQPMVTLHIKGKVANNNGLETETDFNIQTLIVQRRLDQV